MRFMARLRPACRYSFRRYRHCRPEFSIRFRVAEDRRPRGEGTPESFRRCRKRESGCGGVATTASTVTRNRRNGFLGPRFVGSQGFAVASKKLFRKTGVAVMAPVQTLALI